MPIPRYSSSDLLTQLSIMLGCILDHDYVRAGNHYDNLIRWFDSSHSEAIAAREAINEVIRSLNQKEGNLSSAIHDKTVSNHDYGHAIDAIFELVYEHTTQLTDHSNYISEIFSRISRLERK